MFVDEVKLEIPAPFPAAAFTSFMSWARAHLLDPKEEAWPEFAGASNLIAWRFRASVEGLNRYRQSWLQHGAAVGHEEQFARELALFQMFAAGLSCAEAACYAVHASLSDRRLLGVPFGPDEQRRTNPPALRKLLKTLPAAAALEGAVAKMVSGAEWKRWSAFRNRMSHRSNLPPVISGSFGAPLPPPKAVKFGSTTSTQEYEGELRDLDGLVHWLAESVGEVLSAATKVNARP